LKGIILAGGSGSRLSPITDVVSKQLLPIYNKPMIFYPLSTLMLSGIREILLISTPRDLPSYRELLGDGSSLGISITYAEQPKPEGLPQAFIIGEEFIAGDSIALVLGDNIFHGPRISEILKEAVLEHNGATVFGYSVTDPERFGVAEFNEAGEIVGILEKPEKPPSNFAVTGLYFYDSDVSGRAKSLSRSERGELEISELNQGYIEDGRLEMVRLGGETKWLDTGTHDSLLEASIFVQSEEITGGKPVGDLRRISELMGYLND